MTGAAITTDANGTYAARQEPDPLGRELAQAPDPTIAVDPLSSSKWNDPMPIEYTGGPSQEYLNNNAAWASDMALRGLADALTNHYKATAQLILDKNPNIGIRTNSGRSLHGNAAANYLNSLHGEYFRGDTLMVDEASVAAPQNFAQERSDLKGDKNIKPPQISVKHEGLDSCVKDYLAKFFDRKLLDQIIIHRDALPAIVPDKDNTFAYTANEQEIWFNKGRYSPNTVPGIVLIAHEVEHAHQWRKYGGAFALMYLGDSADAAQ